GRQRGPLGACRPRRQALQPPRAHGGARRAACAGRAGRRRDRRAPVRGTRAQVREGFAWGLCPRPLGRAAGEAPPGARPAGGAAEAAALVREQAREAIRLRLAGVVAGLLLSGGLDAAALLALVAADRRPPASAYTATFAGEGRAAARLAAQLGIEHVLVDGEPEWPAVLERLLAAHGGPGASLDDPVFALAAARAAADVRVALAGVGGDEIFGGSAPARAAGRVGYYARLPALAREMIELSTR